MQPTVLSELAKAVPVVLGAFLAILGGIIGQLVSHHLVRSRDRGSHRLRGFCFARARYLCRDDPGQGGRNRVVVRRNAQPVPTVPSRHRRQVPDRRGSPEQPDGNRCGARLSVSPQQVPPGLHWLLRWAV